MTFDPTARFKKFDNRVDSALEHLRDYKFVKVVFSIASAVGDFGILWHIIGLLRAIGSVDRFQQALVFSTMIGIESLLLNQGIKRLFRRSRPTTSGDERFALRTPFLPLHACVCIGIRRAVRCARRRVFSVMLGIITMGVQTSVLRVDLGSIMQSGVL